MKRKRVKKQSKQKIVILVTSIVALNIMGISYASWNGDLQIVSKVNTGNMSVEFSGGSLEIKGDGHIEQQFIDLNSSNKIMNVSGKIVIDYDEAVPDIILNYDVTNCGSIPAMNIFRGYGSERLNLQEGSNNTELTYTQK